jgi:hypothetical protein
MEGFMTSLTTRDSNQGTEGQHSVRITAHRVDEPSRLDFLPTFFGRSFLLGEATVYGTLSSLSPDYGGGYWEFYTLSNGGRYLAPQADKTFRLSCQGNGFEGEVSADAAGVVATLMALNALAWKTHDPLFIDAFYLLREYALEHPEANRILQAID